MDEKSDIIKKFSKMGKENSFSTPDNYFDEFPLKIQNRLNNERKNSVYLWFENFKKPVYAVAFAFVIIFFVSIPFFITTIENRQNQLAYQSIEMEDLYYFDISEDMLIETLNSENLSEIIGSEENNDEVLDYILDNIDYSTLLDEL